MRYFINSFRAVIIRFLQQSKGAVVIEAAFTLIAFVTIIALIIDLGSAFVQQSRLERATYTVASVIRERIALYNDPVANNANAPITQEQVTQLQQIAGRLMNNPNLVVIVDELRFAPSSSPNTQVQQSSTRFTAPAGASCKSTLPAFTAQPSYGKLSPYSSRGRWLPLYRISVCIPGTNSWFKRMVNSSSSTPELVVRELIAFNVVIPR